MFYKNARIFGTDFQFRRGAFEVKDGYFGVVCPKYVPANAIDLEGATVIPGLVDIHTYSNTSDLICSDYEDLKATAQYLAKNGITSFVPTSQSLPCDGLAMAFSAAKQLQQEAPEGHARLVGVQVDGPTEDFAVFQALYNESNGLIRMVSVAPELPGAAEFAEKASRLCTVSVARTEATYEEAKNVFSRGASHLSHLFMDMPGIHHKDPGVISAAAENARVRAELICDGVQVHPSAVRLAFSIFGPARMILVSGPMDGEDAPKATLYDCLTNAILYGIPEADAVRAATYNPACALGMQNQIGAIATGKRADFIVCRNDYTAPRVFLGGQEIT